MASWARPPISVATATTTIGATPRAGASGTNTTTMPIVARLNIAGDSAGTKKWPSAFSIPINTAASATRVRNGTMIRASRMVSSSLPGTSTKSASEQPHQRIGEDGGADDQHAGDQDQGGEDGTGQHPGARLAAGRQLMCEGGHERRAHRTFGEQVADEVGDAEGHAERVHRVAGAEVERQHLIADQAQDAAGHGRQTEQSGRAGQARSGVGMQSGASA